MSILTLNTGKLKHNFKYLDQLFTQKGIEWSIVTKVFCGNETFLKEVLALPIMEFCDSRISNLKKIKKLAPAVQTVYIKPVPLTFASQVITYADVSFNTEIKTLTALSKIAVEQNKIHKTVIMIEMGELREGVVREMAVEFFRKALKLPNIEIVGIGTNLTCMNGVLPDCDKMQQLNECRAEIEKELGIKVPYISGGASVAIPLVLRGEMPEHINHFRVGETLFFGTDVFDGTHIDEMYQDVFKLYAEIIEIKDKPNIPEGTLGFNLIGEQKDFSSYEATDRTKRAIIDVGLLDMNLKDLMPEDEDIRIIDGSSDMVVLDLDNSAKKYKVGDFIAFRINYMGLLNLMNSVYVEKKLESGTEESSPQPAVFVEMD